MKAVNRGREENKRKQGKGIKKSFCKLYFVHFRALISLFFIETRLTHACIIHITSLALCYSNMFQHSKSHSQGVGLIHFHSQINKIPVHSNSCKWPTWRTLLSVYVYFDILHVSSNHVLISRRINFINMTCRYGWNGSSIHTCIPDGHLLRVTYTRCRIDKIDSPDDEYVVARNM